MRLDQFCMGLCAIRERCGRLAPLSHKASFLSMCRPEGYVLTFELAAIGQYLTGTTSVVTSRTGSQHLTTSVLYLVTISECFSAGGEHP
jgi:hypothetical protein